MNENRRGFKAYDPGLVCKGKQYAENTTFEEKGGEICHAGMMHYCTNPLDCLDYYPLVQSDGRLTEFTDVTAEEEPVTDDGKKWATRKMRVGVRLDLKGFVKAAFEFLWEKSEFDKNIKSGNDLCSSEEFAQLAASGDAAKLAASGDDSVVAGIGIENMARAALGCWIVLAEWAYDYGKRRYVPKCVKAAQVDGETIKPDTFYRLINGEFKEVY